MAKPGSDAVFAGSVAELYERQMVPMIFQAYAEDLARRVAARKPARVLETAAGTGVVTRAMDQALPPEARVVATDLNQPMLDRAASTGVRRPVDWKQADAMRLPFEDGSFDVVICQFGVMFFPDKVQAFSEARRLLRRGGMLLFNTWDRIEENDFAQTVTSTLADLYPADPPRFMERTPHGYFQIDAIARDLAGAGFRTAPRFESIASRSRAASAQVAATAYCQGTPLRGEIEARGGAGLVNATSACAAALAARFGEGMIEGRTRAHVIEVVR